MSLAFMEPKMGTISSVPIRFCIGCTGKSKGEKKKPPVVTKTGNSRMIAGYKCDEYKVVDPDKGGYSLVWMTKDLKIKADKRYWGNIRNAYLL